jgi:phosphatidylglycerophosphatase A
MKWLATFISSAGGAGYVPFAPGTWGTLVGCIILYVLSYFFVGFNSGWQLVGLTIVLSVFSHQLIAFLPDTWVHDDGRIVIDEVLGLWVTLFFLPVTPTTLVLGFIFFRIFDIWKPLGIRYFDQLKSNWGVIVDDIVAGVYANIALRGVILILSWI